MLLLKRHVVPLTVVIHLNISPDPNAIAFDKHIPDTENVRCSVIDLTLKQTFTSLKIVLAQNII